MRVAALRLVLGAVLQQAELIRSSLVVLEPSVAIYEGMAAGAADTYRWRNGVGGASGWACGKAWIFGALGWIRMNRAS